MENVTTIDQVSKEVKTKISKLGTASLLNKFNSSLFEGEELIAAKYYLEKRGAITQEADYFNDEEVVETTTTTTGSFGKHASQMSEDEINQAEVKRAGIVAENKQKRQQQEQQATAGEEQVQEEVLTTKKEKKEQVAIIKLTAQESVLFEKIKLKVQDLSHSGHSGQDLLLADLSGSFESLREFKGVLGSLKKKTIINYSDDQLTLCPIGEQMIAGTLLYKQKAKHEQNFFRKTRVVVEIDGKQLEKSAYVRMLLRKNKNTTCSELNVLLSAVGYAKLYHSELQRCKEQLGIVTDKKKD